MVLKRVCRVGVGLLLAGLTSAYPASAQQAASSSAATLARAAEVSTAAPGYRATFTMQETPANQMFTGIDATGSAVIDTAAHDASMSLEVTLNSHLTFPVQDDLDGSTVYLKFPAWVTTAYRGSRRWWSLRASQLDAVALLPGWGFGPVLASIAEDDPAQYIDYLRATAPATIDDLGLTDVRGARTTHYRADIDLAKLADVVPQMDRLVTLQLVAAARESRSSLGPMEIDVWIDGLDRIRRIELSFSNQVAGESVPLTVTENFLQYGPQATPTVPRASETTHLLSLLTNHGI